MPPPLSSKNPTPPSGGRASTNNWDTVFAINFLNANRAIVNQKSSPASFNGTKPGGGFSGPTIDVDGKFGDWQLSGGSGSLAELTLPVSGNAVSQATPPVTLPFTGTAVIQVSLQYVPQPTSSGSSTTTTTTGGTSNALKVRTTTSDPQTQPVVSVLSLTLNSEASQAHDAVSDVLETWLLANLSSFNHTFAAIDLGAVADKDQFQWLAPTKVSYAINNPIGAKVDDYIFGVLAMTENREGVNLDYLLSPNVIPSTCNAGFLISQERFMTKIMMPGIKKMFLNATDSDFQVTGDGSVISNVNAVTFQNFTTSDKDGGDTKTIVGAQLDAQKFSLTANVTTMALNFTDLHFPWGDDGGYTVNLVYDSECELYMDGNKHFQADVVGTPSLSTTVTESSGEKWGNIILGIVEGIGLSVAGAAIGGALGPAAEAAGEGIEGGASAAADGVEGTSDALSFSSDLVPDSDVTNIDDLNTEDDSDAGDDMENTEEESYASKFKGFFRRNWRKILGMAIGGAIGAVLAKVPDILEAYSENELEKMPTLDEFAENAVSPTTWPSQTGYTLVSIALNESLQMGLNVDIAA